MLRNLAVLDAVRDAIFLTDVETGMVVDANRAAQRLCGRSIEELRSLHRSELYPAEGAEATRESLEEEGLHAGLREATVLHKDGHGIPVEISSSTFTAPDGKRVLISVCRDITERHAAQEKLQRSEQRFRQIAEIAGEVIWEIDPEGLFVYVSPVVEKLLGYTPEEMAGRLHFYDLLIPETREQVKVWVLGRFAHREPFRNILHENVAKDGRIVALDSSATPMVDASGKLLGYRGASSDVTGRKAAEETLRATERVYRAIAESIDYGLWVSTTGGSCTYSSESFLKLVGLPPAEAPGFGWTKALHPDDVEPTMASWKECLRTEQRWDMEHRFRGTDGTWHRMLTRGVPVRDEQGHVQCWAGIRLDIAALKETQESLRDSEQRADERAIALQAIMDAAPTMIMIAHDPKCRRVTGNRTAYALLRQQPGTNLSMSAPEGERPTGRRFQRNGVPMLSEELPLQIAVSTGQRVRNCELQVIFDEGGSLELLGNVEPILDEGGRAQGAVAALSDITECKHADAALRESETRFRNMADSAPVMIWVSGLDDTCTFVNRPWLNFTGSSMQQQLGSGWRDGIHPGDRERVIAITRSAFHAQQTFRTEYRMRRADGKYRWILETGVPHYRDVELTGFIGSCIDVTEQKLIEERLRASEARLLEAQRLARVGSWEYDLESDTLRLSDEMIRIFGLVDGGPTNLSELIQYVHPKDREDFLAADRKVRWSCDPLEFQHRIVRPDHEVRFLRCFADPIRNAAGELVRITGAAQDVTEQIQASELLRESEERLKSAERLAHVGFWDWDVKTNRVSWSDEIFQILGVSQASAPEFEASFERIATQDRERAERWVRNCVAERRGGALEVQVVRADGTLRTLSLISEIVLDEEGQPSRMFGSCQDVTESRRAQDEAYARQKLESLGTLASGIAHDFNNLLGGIAAQAELALAELRCGSLPEEELQRVCDVAIQGTDIVRQLMIYAGKETDSQELLDVSRVIAEMLDLLRVSVSKDIKLETDLSPKLPAVRASAAQVRRIVMNLVINASDAMRDRGGTIRVATGRVASGEATTTEIAAGESVEIIVRDTGTGMAADVQARIFDPFFSTKAEGRGLGLAVVQGIVRSLQGTIQLWSEAHKGTTFRILLPAEAGETGLATGVAPIEPSLADAPRATILIVEDEHPLREAIAKMLRRRGFVVLEAANGRDAIALLQAKDVQIDVILLDKTIPGCSSKEVVAEALRTRPGSKVILTSAYGKEAAMASIQPSGVHAFVSKPFRFGDLVQTLRAVLPQE